MSSLSPMLRIPVATLMAVVALGATACEGAELSAAPAGNSDGRGAPTTSSCPEPVEGCACEAGSEPIACQPAGFENNTKFCLKGLRYCRDGAWSACKTMGISARQMFTAVIDGPLECDPCDPDCYVSRDRPVAADLGPGNSTDVAYDADAGGIVLAPTATPPDPWTSVCGDGVIEDVEECDDGNTTSGDGCSNQCWLETGWHCATAGSPCTPTVCGDGIKQGTEPCDDGNNGIGDGCTPFCTLEPSCTGGTCTPVCGDGLLFTGEACDDGNKRDGDGCSSTCTLEAGFNCVATPATPPASVDLPVVFRDFRFEHPDMEVYWGSGCPSMIQTTWGTNAATPETYKKIQRRVPNWWECHQFAADDTYAGWRGWYNSRPYPANAFKYANIEIPDRITVTRNALTGLYTYSAAFFFPLDTRGWAVHPTAAELNSTDWTCLVTGWVPHNYWFTSEFRFWFKYEPGQTLAFVGDDDFWFFVNGRLAIDLGGVHPPMPGTITLNALNAATYGLTPGGLYEAAVFHAERKRCESAFTVTLGGFFFPVTQCTPICGDGIVTRTENCDDGVNSGNPGSCTADCSAFVPGVSTSGSYWRDYDSTAACKTPPTSPDFEVPVWGDLSWSATIPADTSITFQIRAADTQAGLAAASPINVNAGTSTSPVDVQDLLVTAGQSANPRHMRVTAILSSSNSSVTPVLEEFELKYRCVNME